jgi:hypothetical protein
LNEASARKISGRRGTSRLLLGLVAFLLAAILLGGMGLAILGFMLPH